MSRSPFARWCLAAGAAFAVAVPSWSQVEGGVTVDASLPAGTDGSGRVLLYAPSPFEGGSSISHFDRSASPNLLMEPNISPDIPIGSLDLTVQQLQDIGWTTNGGATITLNFTDASGEGFNDPTLGNARRTAMRRAADIWEGILTSSVPIEIDASFRPLACDPDDGATLAQASTNFAFTAVNSAFPNDWLAGALAEALTGEDLSRTMDGREEGDLFTNFNTAIDEDCLGNGSSFDYSLSGTSPAGTISFVVVALHEIAHGLGFANFLAADGSQFRGRADIYSRFTRDTSVNRSFAQMSAAQVRSARERTGSIVWDGRNVTRRAPRVLDASPVLRIDRPSGVAGLYPVSTAAFGTDIQTIDLSAELAIVDDGSSVSQGTQGCGRLINSTEISGKIAVVDRGTCLFVEKANFAQDAGAIALVVVNNAPGLITLGGDDPGVRIPVVMISQTNGSAIKQAIRSESNNPTGGGDPTDPTDPPDPGDPDPPDPPEFEDPSVCTSGANQICLQGGRFRVEMTWETRQGDSGIGNAAPLTSDTGFFTFFDPDNVEAVVKILDACGLFDRFWVFAGGLTDVGAEIKVVDTVTGLVKRYANPLGTPFQPIQDTDAFDTCDAN